LIAFAPISAETAMIGHSIALGGGIEMHIPMVRRWIPVLILLLLLAVPTQATIFINEGFEGTSLTALGWQWNSGYCAWSPSSVPCPFLDLSSDIAFTGTKSLKQVYSAAWSDPNPQINTQAIEKRPGAIASAGGDMWTKYRYRTVGFTYAAQTSTKQVYIKNTQNSAPTWVSNFFWGSRQLGMSAQGMAGLCPTNPGAGPFQSCNLYPNMAAINLADNQWYCIEEHIKFNTPGQPNGNVEIFVNGVQTLGYYNVQWLAGTPTPSNAATGPCCFGWNLPTTVVDLIALYKQNGDGVRYFDDFVVANTRIGCSGTTPPADATPPSPPTNFRVTQLLGLYASLMHQLGLAPLLGV